MKITCIADLHGFYPKLPGGDLLIVAGDLTARDKCSEYSEFAAWLSGQEYTQTVVIAGNHDNEIQKGWSPFEAFQDCSFNEVEYLCDSGTEFEGLKIWGSPWTKTFPRMNPHCKAFTVDTEEELAEKWALIPNDVDILVTHSPAYAIGDEVTSGPYPVNVGSRSMCKRLIPMKFKLHVFGHIHEGYCHEQLNRRSDGSLIHVVNASHVNEHYKPVNAPINISL
jgi:Icc-related predicted phosphoesterase